MTERKSAAMMLQEIKFGSAEFRRECELRNKVLRIPLGLSLFDEDLSHENQQLHFGLFDPEGNLVACVIAAACSPTEAQIRQMAVCDEHRGKGYGRNIISAIENKLAQQGFTYLFMHARMTAVGFYEKLGYVTVGQEFLEIGIPHVKMEKSLLHPSKPRTAI